jgi:hypothetical protein
MRIFPAVRHRPEQLSRLPNLPMAFLRECAHLLQVFSVGGKNANMAAMLVVSIILEAAVAVIAVLAARAGRPYLYGLAFTFAAYVLYDLARLLRWPVEGPLLSGLFLLATITALVAVSGLYWERRGK